MKKLLQTPQWCVNFVALFVCLLAAVFFPKEPTALPLLNPPTILIDPTIIGGSITGANINVPGTPVACDAPPYSMSPSNTAAQNATALAACVAGGNVTATINTPGTYNAVGKQGLTTSPPYPLSNYCIAPLGDNTKVVVGAGVKIQMPDNAASANKAQSIFCNSNVASDHVVVSSNTNPLAGWGSATYGQSGYTVTVAGLTGNTLAVGQIVSMYASGGTGINGEQCTLTSTSTTGFVCTSLGTQSVSGGTSLSLIAFTEVTDMRYWDVTFNTATAPNLMVGGYVLIKGDTSLYNYNHVWQVIAVGATSFTLHGYYVETPLLMSGTVWEYPANNNITVQVDGIVDGGLNTTSQSPFWLLSQSLMYFNKVGTLDVSGNWNNAIVIATISNVDNFVAHDNKHTIGANGFQTIGPIRNINLTRNVAAHTEEFIFASPSDPTGQGPYMQDADGTLNSGGNIGNIVADFTSGYYMANKIFSFGLDDCRALGSGSLSACTGDAIGLISLTHSNLFQSPTNMVNIGQATGANETLGKFSFKEWVADIPANGVPLVTLQAQTLVIDTVEIGQGVLLQGNATLTQLAATNFNSGEVFDLQAVGTSGTINKLKLSDMTVPLFAANSGNPTVGFNTSGAGWTVGSMESDHLRFTELGSGSVSSYGVSATATKIKITDSSITASASNGNTAMLVSRGTSVVDMVSDTCIGTAGCNLVQPFTNTQTITFLDDDMSNGGTNNFPLYCNGCGSLTINVNIGGVKMGNGQVYGYGWSGGTYNIRSLGGNINPNSAHWAANGATLNFYGNASDMKVDVTTISRIDGACVYNTNTSTGGTYSITSAGVVCDTGTSSGSWWKPTNTAGVAGYLSY